MKKILVIGYGNPLRCDDGVGWHLAQELLQTCNSPDVEIIARVQLTPELAEPISRASLVLFVDASRELTTGRTRQERIFPRGEKVALNHQMSPEGLLQLADDVYYARPEGHIFSIGAELFDYGTSPSPTLAKALPSILATVREFIRSYRQIPA